MENKTIQEQMDKLKGLVAWFEGDEFELELAKDRFVEAEKLASSIRQKLAEMKNEIIVLEQKFDKDDL